jgi:hypothetical protein
VRIDDGFSAGDALDGVREIQVHGIFQDVAARAGLECLANKSVLGMHAEHEDCGIGLRL